MSARRTIALVLTVWLITAPMWTAAQVESPLVTTPNGEIRGVSAGAVERFLGIPYAQAPVGDLRLAPPQRAQPWEDVLDASRLPNRCPAAAGTGGARSETEDCLYLNIVRPAGTTAGDQLPVYVFIHGGGLTSGSANQYDFAAMVEANGFIGVSINYRLGVLGFLADPAIGSGNFGLMDQQRALRWVQDSIGAFGGDPSRVTIGGESSGAASVCAHLAAPDSRGLFAAAIMQSGGCWAAPIDTMSNEAVSLSTDLGCEGDDRASCLRALPVSAFIDANATVSIAWGTDLLPVAPATAIANGDSAPVPLLIGWNLDEARSIAALGIAINEPAYRLVVQQMAGEHSGDVLARYPWPADADPDLAGYYAVNSVVSDIFACSTLSLADQVASTAPVYVYRFSHQYGPGLVPEVVSADFNWGAGHAAELPYLSPAFLAGRPISTTFDADERLLATYMQLYWGGIRHHRVAECRWTPSVAKLRRNGGWDDTAARERERHDLRGNVAVHTPVRVLERAAGGERFPDWWVILACSVKRRDDVPSRSDNGGRK